MIVKQSMIKNFDSKCRRKLYDSFFPACLRVSSWDEDYACCSWKNWTSNRMRLQWNLINIDWYSDRPRIVVFLHIEWGSNNSRCSTNSRSCGEKPNGLRTCLWHVDKNLLLPFCWPTCALWIGSNRVKAIWSNEIWSVRVRFEVICNDLSSRSFQPVITWAETIASQEGSPFLSEQTKSFVALNRQVNRSREPFEGFLAIWAKILSISSFSVIYRKTIATISLNRNCFWDWT